MMYDHEKSDPAIVAVKPTNKAGQPAAELVEPRAGAEGNVNQQSTGRAQNRETVSQALEPIRIFGRISRGAVTTARGERARFKKMEPESAALLGFIERWRNEAVRAGRPISRIALAYEAGRDGFWLARWLIARGIEAHVIHSASVAVSRERKRAKTDRLDAAMLMRVFLGWLRGERGHCGMVAIPTMEEEDARRPSRERESLVDERSRITNRMKSALARLGIRGFKPHLRKAPERLAGLRTAEGTGLPANIIEEFRR